MVPAARLSAAIEVLDSILSGTPVDTALTGWGRGNRFAGSGDRAAIRDLVFDALRCKRSFAALGGGMTGRGLMLGHVRASGLGEAVLFNGSGHAPKPASDADAPRPATDLEALDCPDWLAPRLKHSLGDDFAPVLQQLQTRGPAFLRVNLARITRDDAQVLLAADGISTALHPLADTALQVAIPTRKILTSKVYLDGLIELQDAASQAVVQAIPLADGQSVLDYCAGAGGKTLALAARAALTLWAHDANAARMRDLPGRAARAGVQVGLLSDPARHAPYDLVFADVPCSGSGSWRRDPQGKWALTEGRLQDLIQSQAEILDMTARLVGANGSLAYVTCSLLADENQDQITRFLARHSGWEALMTRHLTPLLGGDGFFLAILRRI